jgi:hypothetical protein
MVLAIGVLQSYGTGYSSENLALSAAANFPVTRAKSAQVAWAVRVSCGLPAGQVASSIFWIHFMARELKFRPYIRSYPILRTSRQGDSRSIFKEVA